MSDLQNLAATPIGRLCHGSNTTEIAGEPLDKLHAEPVTPASDTFAVCVRCG